MLNEQINRLNAAATQLRIDSIRATSKAGSGHPTSCMSAAEIISVLFFKIMQYESTTDRFILSKGHAAPVIYAAWKQLGWITDDELLQLRQLNSPLEGHPTPRFPLWEAATGSLGQGLAIAIGLAREMTRQKKPGRMFVLLGDGEMAEGSVWEAAQIATYYKIHNLTAIIDCNGLGQTGHVADFKHAEKFAEIFAAFGWKTHVVDGHNVCDLISTFEQINSKLPTAIIAKTTKGKGLSSLAGKNGFHGKVIPAGELENALTEITKQSPDFSGLAAQQKPLKHPGKPSKGETLSLPNLAQSPSHKMLRSDIATRKASGIALKELGRDNPNIVALDADVGNSTFIELFAQAYPERFTQCFIAEQSMVGIATGIARHGAIPFLATFSAFLSRAHDQLRMAGISGTPLKIFGSHAGVSIGPDGPSQMGLEDIALMRGLPDSVVLYPGDGVSTYKLVAEMTGYSDGIAYLRTTRAVTPNIYDANTEFQIGELKVVKQHDESKITLVAAGITLHEALKAHDQLLTQGIKVNVVDLYCIKPLPAQQLIEIAEQHGNTILTIEDHYEAGGIGEAVSSALSHTDIQVHSAAVTKLPRSGTPEELLAFVNIDADAIMTKVKDIIAAQKPMK